MLAIVGTFDICTLWGSPHSGRCKVKRSGANWHQNVAMSLQIANNCKQMVKCHYSLLHLTFDGQNRHFIQLRVG